MTVALSVHYVREHIRHSVSSETHSPVRPSSAFLGRLFHEVAADLVNADLQTNGFSFLETLDFDTEVWRTQLLRHTYDRLLGPRLARDQARLQESSLGILHLWEAIQSLCGWLVGLAWTAVRPDKHKRTLSWNSLRKSFRAEVPLEAEFRMPEWSEPVSLTGIADSLLRVPTTGNWCVQEYKIGRTSPDADLSQACLYHLILSKNAPSSKSSRPHDSNRSLALISFQPEVHEKIFSEEELASVQEKLLTLIGHLAGVVGSAPRPEGPRLVKQDKAMRDLCQKLLKVFDEYRRPVELAGEPIVGPAFFRFLMNLGHGVKLEQVQRLSREVQVRLGLRKPPFIGVDRGRVVLDTERADRQTIRFEEVKGQLPQGDALAGSPLIPVGIDLDGALRTADLGNPLNAHLLVAGTTGSGKTEWLRTAIHGLIYSNTPATLRLVLIDPKRTAFNEFKDSPFLLDPESLVFHDMEPVLDILKGLVREMDRRYGLFQEAAVDDLREYVRSREQALPRILCVCDEYYALIAGDAKRRREVELQISLLGAKARAAGIHLILATQQPSREVIKGVLDSNIPARVALMMVKWEESKMLLGQTGAENLLGKGDLLFRDIGEPIRLQAPLL
jgi:DNA segregation ATPase FtsK/SpoIIIE, S-DNA-T family